MSVCSSLAQGFGAVLSLDKEHQGGARFVLTLPLPNVHSPDENKVYHNALNRDILMSLEESLGFADTKDVVVSFLDDLTTLVQRMKAQAQDATKLARLAHQLKSTSMLVGAVALSHLCLDLEKAAKANNLIELPEKLSQLEITASAAYAALKDYYNL